MSADDDIRARIQAQRGGHPAERHFTVGRIQGGGDRWVSELVIAASPARAALAEPIPASDPDS